MRHPFAELAHTLVLGIDSLAQGAHLVAQTPKRRTDRDQHRDAAPTTVEATASIFRISAGRRQRHNCNPTAPLRALSARAEPRWVWLFFVDRFFACS